MNRKTLYKTTIITLLIFTFLGCSEQIKYVKTPCPKLVTFNRDKNTTIYAEKIKISVPWVDDNATKMLLEQNSVKYGFLMKNNWGFIRLDTLKDLSLKMQILKHRGLDDVEVLELYERMIDEYNSSMKK